MHKTFCLEKLKESDHLGDVGVFGCIILKSILGEYDTNCNPPVQWRTLVNTVIYFRIPKKVENFLTS